MTKNCRSCYFCTLYKSMVFDLVLIPDWDLGGIHVKMKNNLPSFLVGNNVPWKVDFHPSTCSSAVQWKTIFHKNKIPLYCSLQMNMWKNVFHVFGGTQLSMEHCFPLKKMEDCFPFSHEFVLGMCKWNWFTYLENKINSSKLHLDLYSTQIHDGWPSFDTYLKLGMSQLSLC